MEYEINQVVWFDVGDGFVMDIQKGYITRINRDKIFDAVLGDLVDALPRITVQVIKRGGTLGRTYALMHPKELHKTRKELVQAFIRGEKAFLKGRREYIKELEKKYIQRYVT
jgi:hypothetical protein